MVVTAPQSFTLGIFNFPDKGIGKRERPVVIAPGWSKVAILIKPREYVRVTDQFPLTHNPLWSV
jgi:hypothetical protein